MDLLILSHLNLCRVLLFRVAQKQVDITTHACSTISTRLMALRAGAISCTANRHCHLPAHSAPVPSGACAALWTSITMKVSSGWAQQDRLVKTGQAELTVSTMKQEGQKLTVWVLCPCSLHLVFLLHKRWWTYQPTWPMAAQHELCCCNRPAG